MASLVRKRCLSEVIARRSPRYCHCGLVIARRTSSLEAWNTKNVCSIECLSRSFPDGQLKQLRDAGLSYTAIAKAVGFSRRAITDLLKEPSFSKDGESPQASVNAVSHVR